MAHKVSFCTSDGKRIKFTARKKEKRERPTRGPCTHVDHSNGHHFQRLTPAQSRARFKKLRAQGYRVKRVRLPDGTLVVLRSRHPVK